MVTATYAKPSVTYTEFLEEVPIMIKWSYKNQQDMKTINIDNNKEVFISSRPEEETIYCKKDFPTI